MAIYCPNGNKIVMLATQSLRELVAVSADQEKLFTHYEKLVTLVEKGLYEDLSIDLRAFRQENLLISSQLRDEIQLLKNLISLRLALKTGGYIDLDSVITTHTDHPFLLGEALFVQGLLHFQTGLYQPGSQCFSQAETHYRVAGRIHKALLSKYNYFIGRLNVNLIDTKEHAFQELKEIENEATQEHSKKALGLVWRQKSYLFHEIGHTHAALCEAEKAIKILEFNGLLSDYQLALIQAADCAMDLEDPHKAKLYMEYVISPIDTRVKFPLAYLQARIFGNVIDPKWFDIVVPYWRLKFEKHFIKKQAPLEINYSWKQKSGKLQDPCSKKLINIQPRSLEGRLLNCLIHQKCSKSLLCEVLWPDHCNVYHLDNRLHKLISRLNKKSVPLIQFDGKFYFLNGIINLE